MDRSARHKPNHLLNYLQVHEVVLGHCLYSGLVEEDGLEFIRGADKCFYFAGSLVLRNRRIELSVAKRLEIVDASDTSDPLVQTVSYSYNVRVVGHGNVFRYCSPHHGDEVEHHSEHHRHQYATFGPNPRIHTVSLITAGDWPTMGEVIQEADAWYWDNASAVEAFFP